MSSNLKVNTILPSVGSNIGLGTNGGNLNVDGGCKVQVGTALTLGHTVGVQFATQNLHSAGFEVNQINASGIITASHFYGSGANLTSLPSQLTLSNNADNRVITGGSGTNLNGEANLTFDGTKLSVNANQVKLYNSANTSNTYFYAQNTGAGNAGIKMKNNQGEWTIIANDRLRFIDDDAGIERLSITSAGRIGVNKTNPDARLYLKSGDGGNTAIVLDQTQDAANYHNSIDFKNNGTQYASISQGKDSSNNAFGIKFTTGSSYTERLRIQHDGHVSLRNTANSHQELQWYVNNNKSASIGWGNGSANWEFKHFRADAQADNPYANIDFFTGSTTSPTRALRITEDGNHIREKHSRFACQITYQNKWYSQGEIIQFNTHVNVGNDFDNSNNKYTAPVDGTYYFFFHTNVIRNGSGTYYTDWYKNGSTIVNSLGGRMYDYYTGSGWNNLSGFIGLDLSEGDYISVHSGSADTKYDGNTYGQLIGYLVG